jgi:hypothetical protein
MWSQKISGDFMIRKFGLCLAIVFTFAFLSTALMAQTPITQADVDLFIKISQAESPEAQAAVISESGIDPNVYAVSQGKIASVAGMFHQNIDDATIKSTLAQNPMLSLTDEEFALLSGQKDALITAYKVFAKIQ